MLKRAQISHYKSLAEIDLQFGRSNIIVGVNGSGKSNLIDCFNFIRDAVTEDMDSAVTRRHGVESIRQWSRSRPYNINISLYFESPAGKGNYKVTLSSSRGIFKVHEESGYWSGRDIKISHIGTLNTATFIRRGSKIFVDTNIAEPKWPRQIEFSQFELFLTQISGITTFYSLMFSPLVGEISELSTYSIYPNIIRQPQVVSKDSRLAQDGSNLASIVKKLSGVNRNNRSRLLEALKVVLPIANDIIIQSAGGFYVPTIRVHEGQGDAHNLNMSQISDGTLRMLGLLTAFYQPDAPLKIALEEPEQMIHPGLLPVLRDAAEDYLSLVPESQFFITTHSPVFIDLFNPPDIKWVKFQNGVSEAGQISKRQLALIKDNLFSAGELLVSEGIGE